jgi:hypothetical protein
MDDRGNRAGVTPKAFLDAIRNPSRIFERVDPLGRPSRVFIGRDARGIVNPQTGQVVSTNPLSGKGAQ